MRQYHETVRHERLQELLGKQIRFSVPWSTTDRTGAVTRVGFETVWIGAFVYSHHHLLNLREVR